MAAKKFNTLTLRDKMNLITEEEQNNLGVTRLCRKFNCGKTQVYKILKNKVSIKEEWFSGERLAESKRKLRRTQNVNINKLLLEWVLSARARNIPISGPILKEKAKMIAQRLRKDSFKASNGWLENFKQTCSKAKYVNPTVLDNWKSKLAELIKNYKPENIGNCDETGLYFRALKRDESLSDEPTERLTILLCSFADGTMEKPLVIGKSFENWNREEIPVTWRTDEKASMTSTIMEEWLQSFNQKLTIQKRHILLFLDNATCHPHLILSNIKLCFLPANISTLSHPLDQGVIQNLKMHYRKHALQSICPNRRSRNLATELSSKISVLDAFQWIVEAQNNIRIDCVKDSFRKAGFIFEDNEETNSEQELVDIRNEMDINNVTPQHYVNFNEYLDVTLQNSKEEIEIESDRDDEETPMLVTELEDSEKITSFADALNKVKALEQYAREMDCTLMLKNLLELRTTMEKEAPRINKMQTTINENICEN